MKKKEPIPKVSSLVSADHSIQHNVHLRTKVPIWTRIRRRVLPRVVRLLNIWCIWSGAIRSLVGRIRIQSPTETPHADLGIGCEQCPDGNFRVPIRTQHRVQGIQRLEATFPWVDFVDRQIFLMGFDAAEQFYDSHLHTTDGKDSAIQP